MTDLPLDGSMPVGADLEEIAEDLEMTVEELKSEIKNVISEEEAYESGLERSPFEKLERGGWFSHNMEYERQRVAISSEREEVLRNFHPMIDYFSGHRELDGIGFDAEELGIREVFPFERGGVNQRLGNVVEISQIDDPEDHEFAITDEGFIPLEAEDVEEGDLYNLEIREFIEGINGEKELLEEETRLELHAQLYQDTGGELYVTHWDPGIYEKQENGQVVKKKLKHKDGFFHMADPPENKQAFSNERKFVDNNTYSLEDGLNVISSLTMELCGKMLAPYRDKVPAEPADIYDPEPVNGDETSVEERNSVLVDDESQPIMYSEIFYGWSEDEGKRVNDSCPHKVLNAVRWASLAQTAGYLSQRDTDELIDFRS